ncbi:MAG: transporter substrate-binding protein [Pseudonocardiales bacterium]|nr:transporter substrate-binding protein [Pseudonocardiales bacterium]
MRARVLVAAVGVVALASGLVACSSSKKSDSTGGGTGASSSTGAGAGSGTSTKTIKIGVLADLTGAASSGFVTTEKGIKAYVDGLNKSGGINGQKIEYVMADTASSPAGAQTAAQKLVQSDKVFAIVEVSSQFYGAQNYLLKAGVPVVGGGFDSPLWGDAKQTNLFNVVGVTNYLDAPLASGQFFKAQGVTKCGGIGYGSSVSSQKSVIAFKKSCEQAGLQTTYINNQVPFGSTDVGAIAIAIKNAGVDGLFYSTVPNTAFALNAALRQLGVSLKVASLPTGYGGDLLASDAAVTAAQGDFFTTVGLPAEADTAATQKRAADLTAVGVTGPPTFAEQEAYLAMSGFVAGVKAAGADPTREKFISSLRAFKDFDGDGLLAPQKIDFGNYRPSTVCNYYVQLEGKVFKNVTGSPYCAGVVPVG